MGNSNPKETCPSEMTNDASQETCPSDMANDASQEKSGGRLDSIQKLKWKSFSTAFNGERICRDTDVLCQEVYIRKLKGSLDYMPVNVMAPIQLDKLYTWAPPIQLDKLDTWIRDSPRIFADPYLSEEVNALRQRLIGLKENSVAYEEMSQFISEVIENIRRNQLMEKLKLFIFLLAFLLHSGNDDYKHLARPERGKINCITVYLLGNDGAHSYNGNGILLTTTRRYTRLTNEELLDEIRPANIPLHVLQRQPTDKEIARLSGKIGHEYRQLGFELGLKPAQLDHLIMDYQFTAHRIERMLLIWRDDIEGNATVEILVKAMGMHGINPEIVYQSLERA